MYLISVYFDEKSNRILQRYIDGIAQVSGNDFMVKNQVPPHMTISAVEARSVEVLLPAMEKLRGKLEKGNIRVVSVGQLFPYVIYGTPVLNQYLMDLMNTVYQAVEKIPETTVSKYYQPYSWLPHITLGKTLNQDQMMSAVLEMQEHFQSFEASIVEIGLAKVNPHKDVVRMKLG